VSTSKITIFQFIHADVDLYTIWGEIGTGNTRANWDKIKTALSSIQNTAAKVNSKTAIHLLNHTGMGHVAPYPFGRQIVAFARILQKNSTSSLVAGHSIAYTTSSLSLSALSSLTLTRAEGTFGADCTATLYGLRY